MKKELFDLECYYNFFCCGIKEFNTDNRLFFEISEERNDLELIYNYFKNYKGFLISFNGLHYDEPLVKYLVQNYERYKYLNWENICLDLKQFSDKIILDSFDEEVKKIRYIKTNWISIDLFSYWSKMLRISKKISLKSLGIQLGYPVVQELPYKPESILSVEDLPKLRHYNQIHDLGILELLCNKMEDDIKLRANIVNDSGLDCWSWDAPKIASEALLLDYVKASWNKIDDRIYRFYSNKIREIRNKKFIKDILYLNQVLEGFNPNFKLPIFKNLFNEILNSKDGFSKELIVNYNNTSIKLTYGIGGLHSVNENEQYYTNDEFQIVTSDVALKWRN